MGVPSPSPDVRSRSLLLAAGHGLRSTYGLSQPNERGFVTTDYERLSHIGQEKPAPPKEFGDVSRRPTELPSCSRTQKVEQPSSQATRAEQKKQIERMPLPSYSGRTEEAAQ